MFILLLQSLYNKLKKILEKIMNFLSPNRSVNNPVCKVVFIFLNGEPFFSSKKNPKT